MRKTGTGILTTNHPKYTKREDRPTPLPPPVRADARTGGGENYQTILPRASLADSLCPGLFSFRPFGAQKRRASRWGKREGQDRAVGGTPTAAGETPALPKNKSAP